MAKALTIACQSAFCERGNFLLAMDGRPQVDPPHPSVTLVGDSQGGNMARTLDQSLHGRGAIAHGVLEELPSNQSHLPQLEVRFGGTSGTAVLLDEPESMDACQEILKPATTSTDKVPAKPMPAIASPVIRDITEEDRFVLHLVILSLYKDQIKPQRIEIKHRLQELQCSPSLAQQFVEFYEALDEWYCVERTTDSNITVYLKETPTWFSGWVDMRDTQNPYPLHVWIGFDSYVVEMLRGSNSHSLVTPDGAGVQPLESRGGRYGMSKKLKLTGPTVFKRYSLGQVCHIVQLAVHLGLLAYDGGLLMPAASCRSLVRRLFPPVGSDVGETPCVLPHAPSSPSAESTGLHTSKACAGTVRKAVVRDKILPVDVDDIGLSPAIVDLNEVHRDLRLLLDCDDISKPMLLSQLKFRFLNKFKKRLDPVCFGFTRLSDFLAEKCQQCCRLVREGGRQVLVDRIPPLDRPSLPVAGDLEYEKGSNSEHVSGTISHSLFTRERSVKAADWGASNDSDLDRTTRGLLAIVAKHNRFHCNLTFSFWQFCAEARRLEDSRVPLKPGVDVSVANTSITKEVSDDEDILFCPAARFTDFLFASVLRPAAVDAHHVQNLQQSTPKSDYGQPWSESPIQAKDTGDIPQHDAPCGRTPDGIHASADLLNAHFHTSTPSSGVILGDKGPVILGDKGPPGFYGQRSTGLRQVCQLHWFTRRPLVERQLGGSNPLSDEDVEALQHVFFSVLPPRLPLVSLMDANRVPRPSKLRRQISSQIAQLRREIFCVGNAAGAENRGLALLGASSSTIGPL